MRKKVICFFAFVVNHISVGVGRRWLIEGFGGEGGNEGVTGGGVEVRSEAAYRVEVGCASGFTCVHVSWLTHLCFSHPVDQ